ncbi:MAG: hypothetical protein AB3N14_20235 [Flavobacteriaceae bacterium]
MSKKIKLIWDFRGPEASNTAKHHAAHLKDYAVMEELDLQITGHSDYSSMHSIAFMVVEEDHMIKVRDALIPHRGEIYDQ